MPTHRLPLASGLEHDALTGWRKLLRWRPGERKWVKRKYNKRLRYCGRQAVKSECEYYTQERGS